MWATSSLIMISRRLMDILAASITLRRCLASSSDSVTGMAWQRACERARFLTKIVSESAVETLHIWSSRVEASQSSVSLGDSQWYTSQDGAPPTVLEVRLLPAFWPERWLAGLLLGRLGSRL